MRPGADFCPCCHGFGVVAAAMARPMARTRGHGTAIRLVRERLRWSQRRMGREFLVSARTIGRMERGQCSVTRANLTVYSELARRAGLPNLAAVFDAA